MTGSRQTIYYISGLGADERAFSLLKINNSISRYIDWIMPDRDESLEHYVHKLSKRITDPENSIVIGLSFGGIIAVELSKIKKFKKTIIISSIKSSDEMPPVFKFLHYCKLYRLIPEKLLNRYNSFIAYAFGISNEFENEILKNVIQETDPKLVKWSIDKIITWHNTKIPENIVHIHGAKDRIFPIEHIRNAIHVEDGTHFMIVNKSDSISSIINEELNT